MQASILALITITKDDPKGFIRAVTSATNIRAAGALHVVIHGGAITASIQKGVESACGPVQLEHRAARGIADAFNFGWRGTSAEWIWFLNGGDAVHEDLDPVWLLTLLAKTKADLVVGTIHRDGEAAPVKLPPLSEQWPILRSWPPHPAVIVRRKLLEAVGGFDERWRIAMDFDLWQRIIGRDVVVDVVSVPFARFDVTGMSERPEMHHQVLEEESAIIRRHSGKLFAEFSARGGALLHRCLRAFYHALRRPRNR
jgi:hypothetical protein